MQGDQVFGQGHSNILEYWPTTISGLLRLIKRLRLRAQVQ